MSVTVTRDDLVSTFISAWGATTAVHVGNVQGKPDGSPYILIQLATAFSTQPCTGRDTGATWERDEGDCILAVHVPVDYEADGLQLAENARRVLSQQRFDRTITDVGVVTPVGVVSDGRYYLYNVRIPYRTDSIKES